MLSEILARHGCTVVRASGNAAPAIAGRDIPLDDVSLHHPDGPAPVLAFLAASPNELDYDEWATMAHAIKAALGPTRDEHYGAFEDWCAKGGADGEKAQKVWDSISSSRIGWRFIPYPADTDFDEVPEGTLPNSPEEIATGDAMERMLSNYAYVPSHKQFFCVETRRDMDADQFCGENTLVAPVGRTGERSAAAKYRNHPRARLLANFTYRPGEPAIVDGKANTWQRDGLEPLADRDPEIWLEHVREMIPDEAQREHFLSWCALLLQKPGVKINHACVLLTPEHGQGKDSLIAPILSGVGPSNFKMAAPHIIGKENTSFLEKTLVYVPEVKNFTKGEFYNFTKMVVASPPETVSLRKMYLDAYDIPNIQKWLMTTNSVDAIRLETSDRRYWIVDCVGHSTSDKPYYNRLWGFLDGDEGAGRRAVIGWLLARDVSTFDRFDAPMTDAKREMIDLAKGPADRWIDAQFAEGGLWRDREIMLAKEITDAAGGFDAPASVTQHVHKHSGSQALKRHGWRTLPGRHRVGVEVVTIWVKTLRPEMAGWKGVFLAGQIAADQKKKGAA